MTNDNSFTRAALTENIRRFEQIVSAKVAPETQNFKWVNTFYSGMKHIVNIIHHVQHGTMDEEQVRRSCSRQYYTDEFITKCGAKLMEFTAIVDKHYDNVVHEDVKEYDSESLPVCTPKMIEYVGQNLIRRIMFIAAEPEITEFVQAHPDMLPYPTINENKEEMFFLRALLSSIYIAIVRIAANKPTIRQMLLKIYIQQVITIVPFWNVVDMMNYPFTHAKVKDEGNVILEPITEEKPDVADTESTTAVSGNDAVGTVEPTAVETSTEAVEASPVSVIEVAHVSVVSGTELVEMPVDVNVMLQTAPANLKTRYDLPPCLTKYKLRKLISDRLYQEKMIYRQNTPVIAPKPEIVEDDE